MSLSLYVGDGQFQRVPIPRSTAVVEYNWHMGGVDTSDQMLGTNTLHRKTMRWPIVVFQQLTCNGSSCDKPLHHPEGVFQPAAGKALMWACACSWTETVLESFTNAKKRRDIQGLNSPLKKENCLFSPTSVGPYECKM